MPASRGLTPVDAERQTTTLTLGVCVALLGSSARGAECPQQAIQSWTYTTQADFEQGTFINLNGANDQLQINTWEQIQDGAGQGNPVLRYV
ncbi:MAG TPA: hypothetical protein PKK06_15140 [Phycisphaerae bacterium]|nr:hypothetical protein [Phycisphaerae bacterium]HNU46702.1 hypothetical protein [Phycisphaerae bacterium]